MGVLGVVSIISPNEVCTFIKKSGFYFQLAWIFTGMAVSWPHKNGALNITSDQIWNLAVG